jgi:ankyrin repeat protein
MAEDRIVRRASIQVKMLIEAAMREDEFFVFSYLSTYKSTSGITIDATEESFATLTLHLQRELTRVGLKVVMNYLRDKYVIESCIEGNPPNVEDQFLQLRTVADNEIIEATRRNDVSAVLSAYGEGGRIERPGWYAEEGAIHIAAAAGYSSLLAALLENEPDTVDIRSTGCYEYTPLHRAVLGNHADAAQIILRYKPDLEIRDHTNRTALHMAMEVLFPKGHGVTNTIAYQLRTTDLAPLTATDMTLPPMVEMLLVAGADVNAAGAEDGLTCLHWACMNGLRGTVKLLLERRADLDAASLVGMTPLHCATLALHDEIVSDLLSMRANLDIDARGFGCAWDVANRTETRTHTKNPNAAAERKRKCFDALDACKRSATLQVSTAVRLVRCGFWVSHKFPACWSIPYVRNETRHALLNWAYNLKTDERALYQAFYVGTGIGRNEEIVHVRCICGPTATHHGLRPIRIRMVRYLVSMRGSREMAVEVNRHLRES